MKKTLWYCLPNMHVVKAGTSDYETDVAMVNWLHHMIEGNDDVIFFYTVETTDLWG